MHGGSLGCSRTSGTGRTPRRKGGVTGRGRGRAENPAQGRHPAPVPDAGLMAGQPASRTAGRRSAAGRRARKGFPPTRDAVRGRRGGSVGDDDAEHLRRIGRARDRAGPPSGWPGRAVTAPKAGRCSPSRRACVTGRTGRSPARRTAGSTRWSHRRRRRAAAHRRPPTPCAPRPSTAGCLPRTRRCGWTPPCRRTARPSAPRGAARHHRLLAGARS